jgi:hypothetical protein
LKTKVIGIGIGTIKSLGFVHPKKLHKKLIQINILDIPSIASANCQLTFEAKNYWKGEDYMRIFVMSEGKMDLHKQNELLNQHTKVGSANFCPSTLLLSKDFYDKTEIPMPFLISFDSLRIRHIRTYYLTNDTISI